MIAKLDPPNAGPNPRPPPTSSAAPAAATISRLRSSNSGSALQLRHVVIDNDVVQLIDTALPEVKIVVPERIGDARGFFSEVWNGRTFASAGIEAAFVQDNHARSRYKGTLRGFHYQMPPMAQGKLLRVTRGAVLDVAVDIRRGSPNFGRHVGAVLSADNWHQIWMPAGFAHGYCTLRTTPRCIQGHRLLQPVARARDRLERSGAVDPLADQLRNRDRFRTRPQSAWLSDQVDLFEYG